MLGSEITYPTPTINDQHIEQPNVTMGIQNHETQLLRISKKIMKPQWN
jgi:hypothetical protein